MHPDQLAALEAITDTGTFEAAARRLGVSTSAVSQRIRALESALGRVVVQRGSPSAPTPDGEVVLRYARQQALLAAEMAVELALDDPTEAHAAVGARGPTEIELSVAINADSLATWFPAILREAAEWNCRLRLVVADENNTAELLRSGQVMCAVSSSGTRVAGCRVERLGAVSYSPVIAPGLLTGGVTASSLPVVRFDADDDLQDLALRAAGLPVPPPRAHVPTTSGFLAAIEAGLGWGVFPQDRLAGHPDLVPVPGLATVERELFWHRWSIASTSLDRLTDAVRESFGSGRQPSRGSRTSRASRDSA